jgi:hypothetical protein
MLTYTGNSLAERRDLELLNSEKTLAWLIGK